MLSCWFEVSCHRVMLSVWSHCRVCTITPAFIISQFSWKSVDWTTLRQPDPILVNLHYFPELCRAWGCPSGRLLCAIMEMSQLNHFQNYTEVVPKSDPLCTSHKISRQASCWSTRQRTLVVTSRSTELQNCTEMSCPAHRACSAKKSDNVQSYQANPSCPLYKEPRNCAELY